MARKGVTKAMVHDAIIQIRNEGGNLTTKVIREKLGTGSLSTISKYLDEIRNSESEQALPDYSFDIEDAFGSVKEETICEFLSNEHPQITAAILAQLKPEMTARILGRYSDSKAEDIIERIEKLNPIQHRIMSSIEKVIREEMKELATSAEMSVGGSEFADKVRTALRGGSHGQQ